MGVQIPSVPWVLVCTWSDSPVPAVFDGSVSNDQAIVATPRRADRERRREQDLVRGIGRRREVVDRSPHAGGSDEAPGVHDVGGRVHPRRDDVTHGVHGDEGEARIDPGSRDRVGGPECSTRRAARYLHALLRTVRASPRDRPVSGGAQREARCACVGTGIREVRRGAPRLAGRVHRKLDAHVRAIGEIPRGERLAGRVGCDDRAARRAGRGRDREILRREPRRSRGSRRGERDEQSRGEHERSHDPEHVESLTRGEASR